MDIASVLFVVVCVGSILVIGELADELGRTPRRWMWVAVLIGPFAIPLLYLVAAVSALGKAVVSSRSPG